MPDLHDQVAIVTGGALSIGGGTARRLAAAIAFLCSTDASFITGHALVVDGGLTVQLQEDIGVHLGQWAQQHPDTKLTQ